MKKVLFAVLCLLVICGCSKEDYNPATNKELTNKLTGTFSLGKKSYSFHIYDKTINVCCQTTVSNKQTNRDVDGFCVYRNDTRVSYFYFKIFDASSKSCGMKKYRIDNPTNTTPRDGDYIGRIDVPESIFHITNIDGNSITINGDTYRRK